MRFFTTMSLTLSDGYALYTLGHIGGQKQYQNTFGIRFGMRISGNLLVPKPNAIKKILRACISESSPMGGRCIIGVVKHKPSHCRHLRPPYRIGEALTASQTHLLPDLDGEIYLKARHPADVNGDWVVNI